MLRTALVALAVIASFAPAFAQATAPSAAPAARSGHSRSYRPNVVIDPSAYLASPHPRPSAKAVHNTVKNAAGYQTFHSYSSDK